MSGKLSSNEYMRAIARALDMPIFGMARVTITAGAGEPLIVRVEYVREGTPELLDVLPPPEQAKVESK